MSNRTLYHLESRVQAARRTFCSLKSAGLCKNRVTATTIAHITSTSCYLPYNDLKVLKHQYIGQQHHIFRKNKLTKLVKISLGLHKKVT